MHRARLKQWYAISPFSLIILIAKLTFLFHIIQNFNSHSNFYIIHTETLLLSYLKNFARIRRFKLNEPFTNCLLRACTIKLTCYIKNYMLKKALVFYSRKCQLLHCVAFSHLKASRSLLECSLLQIKTTGAGCIKLLTTF